MKNILNFIYIFSGVILMSTGVPGDAFDGAGSVSPRTPIVRELNTVELKNFSSAASIRKLSFSPDGRYLGIVIDPKLQTADVVIWNMSLQKQQTHIETNYPYSSFGTYDLLWMPNNLVVTFGNKRQWSAQTGEELSNIPVFGKEPRLNRDGNRLLTIDWSAGGAIVNIFETSSWTVKSTILAGLQIDSAAWISNNEIILSVKAGSKSMGMKIGDHIVKTPTDVAFLIVDASDLLIKSAKWFSHAEDGQGESVKRPPISMDLSVSNFNKKLVRLGSNRIMHAPTFEIVEYYSLQELSSGVTAGAGGAVFSNDGEYLILKGAPRFDRRQVPNAIVETVSGKVVAKFPGGKKGIAISPDGKTLAVGDGHSIKFFSIN